MQTERPGGRSTKQDQINAIVTELQQITKRLDALESKDSKAPVKKKRTTSNKKQLIDLGQ